MLIRGNTILMAAAPFDRTLRVRGDVEAIRGTMLIEQKRERNNDSDDEPKKSAFHGSILAARTRGKPARSGIAVISVHPRSSIARTASNEL